MQVQDRLVSELEANPGNARTHSPKQVRQIATSIERFGFNNPVLIDASDTIIAGHGRVEAAKVLGLSLVPTIRLEHLTEPQKRAYIIADNRIAELAGWDRDILAIELQNLSPAEELGAAVAEVDWPSLQDLGFSEWQRSDRNRGIGGSEANIILCGDEERILWLWREKRGEEEQEDLSAVLPVMLGCWTEAFNRQWYEKAAGYVVSRAGEVVSCSTHEWRRCTLDGYVPALGAVWEAKHTSAFAKAEELLTRYMPQLQHNMAVAKAERAILSVIFGNHKWEVFEIAADWLYQEDLLIAEARFWDCVRTGERPVAAPVPPPPKPVGVRELSFEGNNAWASAAVDWLTHRTAAKAHAAAAAMFRSLMEEDVGRAFGHGIEAKRSKPGAVTIRELRS